MKTIRIILLALAFAGLCALPLFLLSGCTADGRFDAATADQVIRTGFDTYERASRINSPERYPNRPVVVPGAPFPIYPVGQ